MFPKCTCGTCNQLRNVHAIISNKLELFSQYLDIWHFHIFKENHTKYREYGQNLFSTSKNLALVFRLNTIGTI